MVIKTASPGVMINEIDLTRGTIDAITSNVGAFAGPFQKGPVDEIVLVSTEEEFVRIFGLPTDENYEYWWTVNNFLEYGGVCYVVRVDDAVGDSSGEYLQKMRNSIELSTSNSVLYPESVYIKNEGDFEENWQWGTEGGSLDAHFVSRSPGDWGNSIGIAVMDRGADYQMSLKRSDVSSFITGEQVEGTFGTLPEGAVLELELVDGGTGFMKGVSYAAITDSPVGSGNDELKITVDGTDGLGPVSGLGDILIAGTKYTDAVDVNTAGGSGAGLTIDIAAEDTGAVTKMVVDNVYNNYKNTLDAASRTPSAKLVPVTLFTTGTGTGAILLANFSTYNLDEIVVSAGGVDYRPGDAFNITHVDGTAVDPTDNTTTITVDTVNASGAITAVSLRDSGTGYAIGDQVRVIQVGSGNNAVVEVKSVIASGAIQAFSIKAAGEDYTVGTLVHLESDGGAIATSSIANGGSQYTPGNYSNIPLLSVAGGYGASANLIVDGTGTVSGLNIVATGYGYQAGDFFTVDDDRIGGTPTGEVLGVQTDSAGSDYTPGTYTAVPAIGGSGRELTVDVLVNIMGGASVTAINDGGFGYLSGESLTVDDSLIGGDSTGEVLTVAIDSEGTGYADGTYIGVQAAGSGTGLICDVTIIGGVVDSVVVTSGGTGYTDGELITIADGDIGGGTGAVFSVSSVDPAGSGFEFSITDVDLAGRGFIGRVDSITTNDATFTVTNISKEGDVVPSGTSTGRYVKVVAPDGLDISDNALAYQSDSNGLLVSGVLGHVVGYENGAYQLLMVSDADFEIGFYLTTNPGQTNESIAGPISAVYHQGEYLLYTRSNVSIDVINTVWIPNTYTSAYAYAEFGWDVSPRPGQKTTPLTGTSGPNKYGDTYVFSTNLGEWILQYTPEEDDLLTDGTNVYKLQAYEDWFKQQIAFQGVPWYRFASRPGTTLNALERGALNDGIHLIVYDADGNLTGSKGNVLETYTGVSKLRGAETPEGENNYYIDVINGNSKYIFASRPLDGPSHLLLNTGLEDVGATIGDGVKCSYIDVESLLLKGGVDNLSASLGEIQAGYDKYDKESVEDMDYILQGPAGSNFADSIAKANFLISIVESRRDCMCFLSPPRYMCVNQKSSVEKTSDMVDWANEIASSSYAVIDSGYKYTYDRFNDAYRYVPLNGDTAGLLVFASIVAEPWFSPAGFSRGQVRNVVKLPFEPSKTQRDSLYAARINPVVTFPGEGTVLYGDKTALAYSSAFDRINVRKLFLVLERQIAKSARVQLFEFNDEITRSLFKNLVNPYLRDVQSKRGMYDFLVVCDSSNNTPEVIDRNEFVADIYIKPARSINFITLNFIATKTGVTFDESVALFRGTNATTNR